MPGGRAAIMHLPAGAATNSRSVVPGGGGLHQGRPVEVGFAVHDFGEDGDIEHGLEDE